MFAFTLFLAQPHHFRRRWREVEVEAAKRVNTSTLEEMLGGYVRALGLMLSTHATREALGVGQGELLPADLAQALFNANLYDIIRQHAGAAELFCYVCKIRPAVLAFVEKVSWACVIRVGGSGVGRERGSNCSCSQGAVGLGKPVERMWCGGAGTHMRCRQSPCWTLSSCTFW